jgi:hypothetical protein
MDDAPFPSSVRQPTDQKMNYPPPPPPRRRRSGWVFAIVALIIVTGLYWNTGNMDSALVDLGLNRNPCIKSIAGGSFCGDEADRLCARPFWRDADACQDLNDPVESRDDTYLDTDGDGTYDDLDADPNDAATE